MATTLSFLLLAGALCALTVEEASSAAALSPRKGPVSARGLFVPVGLDGYAAGSLGVSFPEAHVTLGGVPFDLVRRPGVDNFFLNTAGWSDWEKDPSSYYADYDRGPDAPGDPRQPLLKIPVADYQAVYLLAATDNDRALSPVISFRIGVYDGARRVVQHDFAATVPRLDERGGAGVAAVLPTPAGNLFLVRVPLGKAFAQDFQEEWAFDVEVTRELRLAIRRPDPCRFQYRPLGLPSGVHLFGMTFQRAPVQMEVTSGETGHIFNEPQVPTFRVALQAVGQKSTLRVEAAATDAYGNTTTAGTEELTLSAGQRVVREIALKVPRRGYHDLAVRVHVGGKEILRRETTFALLPRDTRRHRAESPFGVWDFGGTHYTPSDPDVVGPLYVKAGLRYGMFHFAPEARRRYGVLAGNEPKSPDILAKALEKDPDHPKRVLIFHEDAISGAHIMRVPDLFTGRSPYRMDEKEQARFDALWKGAVETATATRKGLPDAHLSLGNGAPQLLEEFLRHRFPKELFDSRGNECGSFQRMPESQPPDFTCNNAGLWMDRQILDHYGYQEKPVTQCYEICYPSTNPGNLGPRTQAAYLVRHVMHSLAWGVPIVRPSLICDVGNSYYFSNWGASALCYAMPDVRPKPSYVAFATMTQALDGARFSRVVPAGSNVVYAFEFRRQGGWTTVLWTLRGTRPLARVGPGVRRGTLTDLMGNERPLPFAGGRAQVEVSPEPVFLATTKPLAGITPGPAVMAGRPAGQKFAISSLGRLSEWKVESERSPELEWYNFVCPRRKGEFAYRETSSFEGEQDVLEVAPRLPVPGSPYLPMYSVLAHAAGVEIPGRPTEIGLMVNGNGGWGRVIFELEDASGQRWISLGAAQSGTPTRWMADWMSPTELAALKTPTVSDWNTTDAWRHSAINFEGWRYLRFPLPGNYPGEGYHWPYSSQWRHSGDGVVKYPLRFRKLVLELPEKVLFVKEYAPVSRPALYLKDLMVTYEPPEKAFRGLELEE